MQNWLQHVEATRLKVKQNSISGSKCFHYKNISAHYSSSLEYIKIYNHIRQSLVQPVTLISSHVSHSSFPFLSLSLPLGPQAHVIFSSVITLMAAIDLPVTYSPHNTTTLFYICCSIYLSTTRVQHSARDEGEKRIMEVVSLESKIILSQETK